jgi:hypothetical protein
MHNSTVLAQDMKLAQQVVSLAIARKLKESGVKQESYFAWYEHGDQTELVTQNDNGFFRFGDFVGITPDTEHGKFYAAFTVAELGELLPAGYPSGHTAHDESDRKWICHWYRTPKSSKTEDVDKPDSTYAATEADARAKMLIWLIENKRISVG